MPTTAHAAPVPAAAPSRPPIAAIWRALAAVPDPEIPALSIVDLGILRGVEWEAADPSTLEVVITPTYSGCPATEAIGAGIRDALGALGVARVRLSIRLAPAWTTEWIGAEARRKLREYGIAPPGSARPAPAAIDVTRIGRLRRAVPTVACPRCGSERTDLLARFGSTACKAQYRCRDCLEPFDYFKPH